MKFSVHVTMAVAWAYSDHIVIRYVLPLM